MRVLVACEFSGVVRQAFTRAGHQALSVDLVPSEIPGCHVIADVLTLVSDRWDMMLAFPPCTYLAISGASWHWDTPAQARALAFVRALMAAPIPRIALENPVGKISTAIRKPDQIIQPYQFGHGEKKRTCLWLKGLPRLVPTEYAPGRLERVLNEPGGRNQARNRSRTYPGIASAMAAQWGQT